jgi:23S rRNA (cytosine1962-C5)-methyltransferase
MWTADNWRDYELIEASDGKRLERWGDVILVRPDPQVIWTSLAKDRRWKTPHGVYVRSKSGGGEWAVKKRPESWTVSYGDLRFVLRPMGFKHTGLFPEQATNWDWFSDILMRNALRKDGSKPRVLNLFAYTGGATAAAAAAGAEVVHVDAAKGMVAAAKENLSLSGLADAPVRYIVDDCKKFVEREIRRGRRYEGIIMDPPSYGRGPGGELWKLEDSAHELIRLASSLLSDDPLFFLVNSYTTGLSPASMSFMLGTSLRPELSDRADIEAGEIGLPISAYKGATFAVLPAGASVRCEFE